MGDMRVAVIGGTGLVGRHTTKALRDAGHDVVVVARSTGVDLATGAGLDAELAGITAVIDVTNTAVPDAEAAREFFGTTHREPPCRGAAGGMVVDWTQRGDVATVPPLLLQPVAASDVGQVCAEIATGPPQGRDRDLAGPETQDLVDMARRAPAARGRSVRLAPAGGAACSASTWPGKSCCPAQTLNSPPRPSTPGSPAKPNPQRAMVVNSTARTFPRRKRRCGRVHDVDRRGGSAGVGGG